MLLLFEALLYALFVCQYARFFCARVIVCTSVYLDVYMHVCESMCVYLCVCVCVEPWSENAACGWNLAQTCVWFGLPCIFNILSQHLKIRIFHIKIQLSSFS